jgi:stage V sporulation protein R
MDERIEGNEVEFARVHAKVTALPRVGLNPYALGMRIFGHVEEMAEKGKLTYEFQRIEGYEQRKDYDKKTGDGLDFVFRVREDFSDFMFINSFVDQDFVDQNRVFVSGRRLNNSKGVWEYYVKSRDAVAYKQMLLDALYHPPHITIEEEEAERGTLYLNHHFEGKPLIKDYIPNTLLGIEYLWGGPVKLETTEVIEETREPMASHLFYNPFQFQKETSSEKRLKFQRVLYTMDNRKMSRDVL